MQTINPDEIVNIQNISSPELTSEVVQNEFKFFVDEYSTEEIVSNTLNAIEQDKLSIDQLKNLLALIIEKIFNDEDVLNIFLGIIVQSVSSGSLDVANRIMFANSVIPESDRTQSEKNQAIYIINKIFQFDEVFAYYLTVKQEHMPTNIEEVLWNERLMYVWYYFIHTLPSN